MLLKNLIKKPLRYLYVNTFGYIRNPKKNLYFLYGHYPYKKYSSDEFENLIKDLSTIVDFIDFDDAIQLINKNIISLDKPTVCFSFDDGFKDCYTHIYPVLKKYNVNACFFINPNFIDGNKEYIKEFKLNNVHIDKDPLTKKMILEMYQEGFIFGSHTMDHVNLAQIDNEEELKYQIIDSKLWIEDLLKAECKYFAWPYGTPKHISEKALEIIMDNYDFIFAAQRSKYYKYDDKIINRDHFEGFWSFNEVKYFLSQEKVNNI